MNKLIFKKHFSGSIDALLKHCQDNADFVNAIVDGQGREESGPDDETLLAMIRSELPQISDDEAYAILDELRLDLAIDDEAFDSMIEKGLIERKSSPSISSHIPLFGLTRLGELVLAEIKRQDRN